ncbi:R2-like ligand-binding oxidase [Cytobacillus purgationiresistens]|uniref:Ribonucleoside-diphosphate reductase beta chain n=1 Tax=Cytobacillus purgationiresistens TaxID=863449 RepID=A0ABU0AKH3_9BACI|nr:R2-like ligand-binding oxidase [Cytobacillus purgationiresistens]MDQ0271384.1 ribonucleoside-diphosphate reductase beta chain [Cytobacillus purgationiresistens]
MRYYASTSERGINRESLPFKLYEKAKKFGTWDPRNIDFSRDKADWESLSGEQRESLLTLISFFYSAEEAVTKDVLPLIYAISKTGQFEEEMYLTTFLFEEAKHTDFFSLLLQKIGVQGELNSLHTPAYRKLFDEILPETMERLLKDQSPKAIAGAAVVYNMFTEGILAESGYWTFYQNLVNINKMPGLLEGITNIKRDESRHIGFGTFLLQRLISEDASMLEYVLGKLQELMPLALQISEAPEEVNPFGVAVAGNHAFMQKQLNARIEVLKRAKGKTLEEIYKIDVVF